MAVTVGAVRPAGCAQQLVTTGERTTSDRPYVRQTFHIPSNLQAVIRDATPKMFLSSKCLTGNWEFFLKPEQGRESK